MIIDNKETVIRDRKMQFILPISILVIICFLLFTNILVDPVGGINRMQVITALILFYIFAVIYFFLKNYNYLSFNINDGKYIFKYYSLKPFSFNSAHKQIEIPIDTFKKYEIKRSLMGIKEDIILYQRVNTKVAKYPPISLTALTKKEKETLLKSLTEA